MSMIEENSYKLEVKAMKKLAQKTLREKYMVRAIDISSGAIRLVNDYFLFGVQDDVINKTSKYPFVDCNECQWTLTDLDRALDAMEEVK